VGDERIAIDALYGFEVRDLSAEHREDVPGDSGRPKYWVRSMTSESPSSGRSGVVPKAGPSVTCLPR